MATVVGVDAGERAGRVGLGGGGGGRDPLISSSKVQVSRPCPERAVRSVMHGGRWRARRRGVCVRREAPRWHEGPGLRDAALMTLRTAPGLGNAQGSLGLVRRPLGPG